MGQFSLIKALRDKTPIEEIIEAIRAGKADIDERDEKNVSILGYAIQQNLDEITSYLIKKGARLNAQTFYASAYTWNAQLVELHLNKGLHPDLSQNGYTPLLTAMNSLDRLRNSSLYPNLEKIVRLLLENGADIHATDAELGQNALHLACHYGTKRLVTKLLEHYAEIDVEDHEGYTPLHHVCVGGYDFSIIEQLLEYGADLNIPDSKHGRTPLHTAVLFYRYNAVCLLKKLKADKSIGLSQPFHFQNKKPYFDIIFPTGTTPFQMATQLKMHEIASVLADDKEWQTIFV